MSNASSAKIKVWESHWFCVVPLIPAAIMIVIHRVFGLSNAIGGIPAGEAPPTTEVLLFNYGMAFAFYAGVAGYTGCCVLAIRRGVAWLIAKFVLLVAAWSALLAWWGTQY